MNLMNIAKMILDGERIDLVLLYRALVWFIHQPLSDL